MALINVCLYDHWSYVVSGESLAPDFLSNPLIPAQSWLEEGRYNKSTLCSVGDLLSTKGVRVLLSRQFLSRWTIAVLRWQIYVITSRRFKIRQRVGQH